MNNVCSIGVIGGADGPTSFLIAGGFPWDILLFSVICLGTVVWYFKHKK